MKATVKARRMGGSVGVILPTEVVKQERITINDTLRINVERADDLTFLSGSIGKSKRATAAVLRDIDEGET